MPVMGLSIAYSESVSRDLLTRDADLLALIIEHQRARGCAPSRRELAAALRLPSRTIIRMMARLAARGYLEPTNRRARSIVVLREPSGRPFAHNSARIEELEERVSAFRAEMDALRRPRCTPPQPPSAACAPAGARCATTRRCRRRA